MELSTGKISEVVNPTTLNEQKIVVRQEEEGGSHARLEREVKTGKPVVLFVKFKQRLHKETGTIAIEIEDGSRKHEKYEFFGKTSGWC